jgi:hypothetical protein
MLSKIFHSEVRLWHRVAHSSVNVLEFFFGFGLIHTYYLIVKGFNKLCAVGMD